MFFGSTMLEVAIGMVFVYLLLSLLCSALGEYIEAKVGNRAKYLRQGIDLLLNETKGGGVDLAQRFYDHGLVRPLYRDNGKLPSYIPSRTFALALWNMATTAGGTDRADGAETRSAAGLTTDLKRIREVVATQVPNAELRTAILTLIDEANGDLARAQRNIEEWYDGMMDRVSGWYKRHTTVLMLALGCALAAVTNADTVNIVTALSQNGALRSSIVAAAEQRLAAPLPVRPAGATLDPEERDRIATENLQQARVAVDSLGLPIGWVRPTDRNAGDPRRPPADFEGWVLKLFGILLTGLAVSQGSPFWFDLLNKIIVIRSTVKPAEKSQQQPSKDKPANDEPTNKN